MSSILGTPAAQGLLGTATTFRGMVNTVTLVTAFVLSIMVINNYRTCDSGKGYPEEHGFQKFSYGISIAILVVACILFALDIFHIIMKRKIA